MSKPKSNNRRSKADCTQTPSVAVKDFCVGSRVRVSSTHPLFPGLICTISALPSPDAVIVELESGVRERLLLKYLKPLLEQNQEPSNNLSERSYVEAVISDNPTKQLPSNDSGTALVEVVEPLTPDEERERHRLELKVERAFIESAAALRILRDRRLYRDTHPNDFIGYCRDRFSKTKQAVNYLIAALEVYENLTTTNGCRVLPTNERQCRELTKLPLEKQSIAWDCAVEENNGKVPSGRIVKSIVLRLLEKPLFLASDYCKLGEVFFLTRLSGDKCKYNGCWAIAIEVENRFTVKAAIYKGDLEVNQENIKRIDSQQTQAEIREIHQRLKWLIECQLDPIDEAQIEILCRRPWFTDRQKQALSAMETVYGVK